MKMLIIFFGILLAVNAGWGQSDTAAESTATDHFRSAITTGDWNVSGSWESSSDGISNWVAATLSPTSAANTIRIRNGHTIALTATETADQLVIDSGGQLTIYASVVWTLANGTGTDLVVNGTLLNSGGTWTVTGASWQVNAGGTYIHNTSSSVATPLAAATLDAASNFIYRGSSVLIPAISYSGRTYGNLSFESASGTWSSNIITGASNSSCTDYTLGSGVTLNITYTGTFTINGNFTIDGTLAYGTGTQSYAFAGSGKIISGSVPTIPFENVSVVSGASYALGTDISLSNSGVLSLSNGTISLGDNNLLLANNSPTAAIGTFNAASFIITNATGTLQRSVSGAGVYAFPVGYSTALQEARIAFSAPLAGGPSILAVRFITGYGGSNGLPLSESGDNITRVAVMGYWEVNASSGFSDSYTGTFIANSFGDIINYTKLHLVKRSNSSSNWVLDGIHVATTGTNPLAVLQRTGMSGFSQFGVGGENNVSLPVTMFSFSGYKDGTRNQLRWTTASEHNNRGFEVLRATDGINFALIGFVNSQAQGGNSNDMISYAFTDNAPAGTRQYYRLQQVDFAGHGRLGNIVLIRRNKPALISIEAIFPNPARNSVNLQIAVPAREKLTVFITDITGRTVLQQIANVETGCNTIPVDIRSLRSGTYLVRINNSSGKEGGTARFVKQ